MKLSIIIPCYNEIRTIEPVIEAVSNCPYPDKEIIVVDDCSTDGTREKLKQLEPRVSKVIYQALNQGKGSAIKAGMSAVTGDIVIIQDADLEYDPDEIPKVVQPIVDGKADVVYGSRFMYTDPHRVVAFWHRLGNRMLTTFSNMITGINLTDSATCYKAFRADVIRKIELEEKAFAFCPEVTAKICKMRCRIYEVGISYAARSYEEGKKIRWKDGFYAVCAIIKYNWFRSQP
jgi:glycosyltransferase involved in cell wall biosynthesis